MADVVRLHARDFVASHGRRVTSQERRVLRAVTNCRTAVLGGHVDQCSDCGHRTISYNSCRNRHCPKCQALARAEWLEKREAELLPVQYFHVVFTMPQEIAAIALQNRKVVYGILFKAAAETLHQVARKHLDAQIGVLAVLHTWGQRLEHHPHVHCVVPGGGLSADRLSWVPCRAGFFVPVRVLSRLFRGKFLSLLKAAHRSDELTLAGKLAGLQNGAAFARYLRPLHEKEWFVYSKPPFGGPLRVLKYLARYTHRVAIANSRLVALNDGRVTFLWKDYAHGDRKGVMTLDATEFIRRFLLHVLPKGFTRIRHYGLFANRHRKERIETCRQLIETPPTDTSAAKGVLKAARDEAVSLCPECGQGTMVMIETFDSFRAPLMTHRCSRSPPDADR